MTRNLNIKVALADGSRKTISIPNPKIDSEIIFPTGIFGDEESKTGFKEQGVIAKIREFTQKLLKEKQLCQAWEPQITEIEECYYAFTYEKEVANNKESWEQAATTRDVDTEDQDEILEIAIPAELIN